MSRQPIVGLVLFIIAIAGALATHNIPFPTSQAIDLAPIAQAERQPATPRLERQAALRALAEWQEELAKAEVRLMAFSHLKEKSAAGPDVRPQPFLQGPEATIGEPLARAENPAPLGPLPAETWEERVALNSAAARPQEPHAAAVRLSTKRGAKAGANGRATSKAQRVAAASSLGWLSSDCPFSQ
jgi:hypothetical protein